MPGLLRRLLPPSVLTLGLLSSAGLALGADPCAPEPSDLADVETVARWLVDLQFGDPALPSFGAVRLHHTPGYLDAAGTPYFEVIPYNASLAVAGLLRAPVADRLEVARRWIVWYLAHVNADGTIHDHWYRADGTGETTCLAPEAGLCRFQDAADSAAGTFLGVVEAYLQAGGDAALLRAERARLEGIAGTILALQQADGLTWARSDYRVKFTFDASEVYWGLTAIARLEAEVFDDRAAARRYAGAADRVRDGLRKGLYDRTAGLYRVAKLEDGSFQDADLAVWYPGTVAVVWPHLFGVTAGGSPTARAQMAAVDGSWDGAVNPDWTATAVDPAGFLWPSVGHAALLTGDCARARAHARFVKSRQFPDFPWPWTADDGGWLLRTLGRLGGF